MCQKRPSCAKPSNLYLRSWPQLGPNQPGSRSAHTSQGLAMGAFCSTLRAGAVRDPYDPLPVPIRVRASSICQLDNAVGLPASCKPAGQGPDQVCVHTAQPRRARRERAYTSQSRR